MVVRGGGELLGIAGIYLVENFFGNGFLVRWTFECGDQNVL